MVIRDYIDKLREQCAQEVWFRGIIFINYILHGLLGDLSFLANKKKLPRSCERLETITGKKLNFKR